MRSSLLTIFVLSIALAGCAKESEKLEKQYEMAASVRELSFSEKCRFESQIRDAYLREENKDEFKRWDESAEMACWFASRNL